jgi:peptide/nickel transport system permease protein
VSPGAALLRAIGLRVGRFVGTLVGAWALLQLLLALAPGDPIDLLPNGPEVRATLEVEWGLDQPVPVRILNSLRRASEGDLGTSLVTRPGAPVSTLAREAWTRSLGLLLPALALGLGSAALFGALRLPGPLRRPLQALSVLPAFLAAYLSVSAINALTWALLQRGLIARPDWFALPDTASGLRTALAIAVLAWSSGLLSGTALEVENELSRLRQSGFIEAARARGAPTWPHLLLNLLPVGATLSATLCLAQTGGVLVVEKLLLIDGAGSLLWDACARRDYPLALGLGLGATLVVATARLLADTLRLLVDPREREALA